MKATINPAMTAIIIGFTHELYFDLGWSVSAGFKCYSLLIVVSALTIDVYVENIHFMVNLSAVVGFEWDNGNARKSQEKHAVGQDEAEQVFFNEPLLLLLDEKHSKTEVRYHAYGQTDTGRKLHISFTLREHGTLIRVISARDMHRKERITYEKA